MTSVDAADSSTSTPIRSVELDPRVALRPGRFDPFALWVVYLLRKSTLPLFFLSALVLSLVGRDGENLEGVDTFGEVLDAIESPLILLVVAVGVRILAAVLGVVLAYPLSHRASIAVATHQGRLETWGRWMDRLHVTRAYRSLRWTKAVRDVAAERCGAAAGPLRLIERLLSWALPILVVGSILAHSAAT